MAIVKKKGGAAAGRLRVKARRNPSRMPGKKGSAHPDHAEFFLALGRRLRALRKERGWSIHHMVVNFGYYDTQWRKYEKGGPVTVDSLLKMSTMFELTLVELLDGLGAFPRMAMTDAVKKPGTIKFPAKKTAAVRTRTGIRRSDASTETQLGS